MTRMIWHIWKSCDIYKIDGTRLTQILRMIYTVGIKFYAPCGCFLGRVGRKKCWGKPPKSDGWSSFSPVNMFFDFIPHSLDSHISVDDLIYSALRSRQIFAKKNPQLAKLLGGSRFWTVAMGGRFPRLVNCIDISMVGWWWKYISHGLRWKYFNKLRPSFRREMAYHGIVIFLKKTGNASHGSNLRRPWCHGSGTTCARSWFQRWCKRCCECSPSKLKHIPQLDGCWRDCLERNLAKES